MSICSCPTPFPTVGNVTCKENFGQVQKVVFLDQKVFRPMEVSRGNSLKPYQLQDLLTQSRGIMSPFLEAPTQEAGDPIVFGGGNDTPNGIEKYLDSEDADPSYHPYEKRFTSSYYKNEE